MRLILLCLGGLLGLGKADIDYPTNGRMPSCPVGQTRAASLAALARPVSCLAIRVDNQSKPTGTYTIYPSGSPRSVFCDMATYGGGWTLTTRISARDQEQRLTTARYYSDLRTATQAAPSRSAKLSDAEINVVARPGTNSVRWVIVAQWGSFFRRNTIAWRSNFGAHHSCRGWNHYTHYGAPGASVSWAQSGNYAGGCGGWHSNVGGWTTLSGIHTNDGTYRGGYTGSSSIRRAVPAAYRTETAPNDAWHKPGYVFEREGRLPDCVSCPAGQTSDGRSGCFLCPDNTYGNAAGQCAACPNGMISTAGTVGVAGCVATCQPPVVQNGQTSVSVPGAFGADVITPGTVLIVGCNVGFVLAGPSTTSCTVAGTLTVSSLGPCYELADRNWVSSSISTAASTLQTELSETRAELSDMRVALSLALGLDTPVDAAFDPSADSGLAMPCVGCARNPRISTADGELVFHVTHGSRVHLNTGAESDEIATLSDVRAVVHHHVRQALRAAADVVATP